MSDKSNGEHGEFYEGKRHNYVAEILDNHDDVASATDMTGMIPTPPLSEAQSESYSSLYAEPEPPAKIGANQLQEKDPPSEH